MTKDYGPGIFSMSTITTVVKTRELQLAKSIAEAEVDANSTATEKNRIAAKAMILKSRSTLALGTGMTNFSLSHQGLKVLR